MTLRALDSRALMQAAASDTAPDLSRGPNDDRSRFQPTYVLDPSEERDPRVWAVSSYGRSWIFELMLKLPELRLVFGS